MVNFRDDAEIIVHRPGRNDTKMTWGQWLENEEVYRNAGFSFSFPEEPEQPIGKGPAKVIKSLQGACVDDDPAGWDDKQLIDELADAYDDDEAYSRLPTDMRGFNYREWAKKFIRSLQGRFVLTAKQRESALKLYRKVSRS